MTADAQKLKAELGRIFARFSPCDFRYRLAIDLLDSELSTEEIIYMLAVVVAPVVTQQ